MKNKAFITALALVALLVGAYTAYANPSYFLTSGKTATATTTLVYMSPGAATTTITYDTLEFDTTRRISRSIYGADDALLLVQYTASSTVSTTTLNMRLEYSMDNVDWYPLAVQTTAVATTTPLTRFSKYVLTLENDTSGVAGDYLGSGTATRLHQAIKIDDVPTRYVRAIFSVPTGSINGALWAEFQPMKEAK